MHRRTLDCICGKKARYHEKMRFNGVDIDGWICDACKETFYNPEKAQQILAMNALMKHTFELTLSQIKSNLILRIPKEVSDILHLQKGEKIGFQLRGPKEMVLIPLRADLI